MPKKIIDKLKYNKYEEGYKCRVLLLHNFMPRTGSVFDSDTHLYSHVRHELLTHLQQLLKDNKTEQKYDQLVFLDFSAGIGPDMFNIIDLANPDAVNDPTAS